MATPPHVATFTLFSQLPTELRMKIYFHIHSFTPSPRILKISYCPTLDCFISNTPPPILLSISSESRCYGLELYVYLSIGSSCSKPKMNSSLLLSTSAFGSGAPLPPLPIPFSPANDTVYISSLSPLFPEPIHNMLYHLSTSASRHLIQSLAIDLRVWDALCENGLLGCLGRMKGLRKVAIVVEFGRCFHGELGFLEVPEWRSDLSGVAWRAGNGVRDERIRARGGKAIGERMENGDDDEVTVSCVLLTRGGEQA